MQAEYELQQALALVDRLFVENSDLRRRIAVLQRANTQLRNANAELRAERKQEPESPWVALPWYGYAS
jgi:predicted RNase H-like nuclease (RuvC/YqgF family)